MIVNNKTGHIKSNFHKRREWFAFTVKKHEFDRLEINQKDNIVKDVIKDCKDKYLHSVEYRCEYDIKFEHKTSGEVIFKKN